MKTSNTLGLSILAGGLAFVGSANAVDLIVNGSFEAEGRVNAGSTLTGWSGFMGTYNHSGEAYYAGPAIPESEGPGALYSWQHRATSGVNGPAGVVQVTQTVDLTTAITTADIDAGRGRYTFSTWLASYTADPEQPYVTVRFFDTSSTQVGSTVIFDRTTANFWVRNADPADLTPPSASNHMFAKYQQTSGIPQGARTATVGIGRSPNAGLGGSPDTYVDLIKLDVETVVFVPPSVTSAQPSGAGTRPDANVSISLQDGTTQVNTNSIQLSFDGIVVGPVIQKSGSATTITYDPPGLLPSSSSHLVRLVFADNGTPVLRQTNEFSFSVLRYYNILLPSPIYLETFESTPEGSLPAGWTPVSHSDAPDPTCDPLAPGPGGLQDLNSGCYTNWVVVDSARFSSPMLTYNGHTPETDYQRVLSTNVANVVNGAIVENVAQGKIAFGDSGYRDGNSQVVYLFSPDFDLTGRNNVYLAFHSLWEQNQDSIGAVEYSVDEGATWLPVVYMLDDPDILRDASGQIDAALTFSTPHGDVATYIDPNDGLLKGGNYGAFIGVVSNDWGGLGPYIQARLNDDPVESKRVEVYRLPAADNKSKVRLRFAHAGTDSWYFGIDNVGFYSLSIVSPPLISGPAPTNFVEAVGNSAAFTVGLTGIGPFTYQWQHNGANLPGQTSATLGLTNLQATSAGGYSVVVGYVGGSITSSPAALVVFTPEPARVIGQWDFNNADLSATCGHDLEYFDSNVEFNTGFADADFFGLPHLDGQSVIVMNFPGASGGLPMGGYKMRHGLSGTGGGTNVNQYTLIMDIIYPSAADKLRRTLLQTDPSNISEGDFRINEDNAVGVTGNFHGTILTNTWYRIALAVDLAGPGPNPIVTKFINGVKVGQHALAEGRDGRWSLSANPDAPFALLLADNDVDAQAGYVSSVQLRVGRLSDAAIAAMGGPQATKIPGAVCAQVSGPNIIIKWSGSVLQSAGDITGPWNPVSGATKPYSVPPPLGGRKFYRSR